METQQPFGPRVPQRGQLQYPLDLESEGALKLSLENVLKDVIVRRNRIQTTLLSGATSFEVASSYMVMTAQAAVTIATIKGGREGMILTLQFGDGNITITDTGTGAADTVNLSSSFTSAADQVLQLLFDGTSWREVGRGTVIAASMTASGIVELATDAETHTGTDTSRALTPSNITSIIKRVYKSADETVNNSDVLQNDNELLFAMAANEVWQFYTQIYWISGVTPDIKFQWSVPSGTTMIWADFFNGTTVNTESTTEVIGGAAANRSIYYQGTVFVSSTPGNLQLQWAQNLADLSDTKVLKGSYIIAHRLA